MAFIDFDSPVSKGGYCWWYIDAVSDDGQQAITIIIFVGSVFSPYYAWSREKGSTKAENHCAINVALYGQSGRWCMTERAANSIDRKPLSYRVGPSLVFIENDELICCIDELAMPLPLRVAGKVRLKLTNINTTAISLDEAGQHQWRVIAPNTRIRVDFEKPNVTWQGNAYVDSNHGHEPMENAFQSWNWSRAHLENGNTLIQYDVNQRSGLQDSKTFMFDEDSCTSLDGFNQCTVLPKTRYWRVARSTRLQADARIENLITLEDTPFYSRNRFNTDISGNKATCIHESVDFDRLKQRWVQCLLPFRMPRNTHWRHPKTGRESNATIK